MRTYETVIAGVWQKRLVVCEAEQLGDGTWQTAIVVELEYRDADGLAVPPPTLESPTAVTLTLTTPARPSNADVMTCLATQLAPALLAIKRDAAGADLRAILMPVPVTLYIPADAPLPKGAKELPNG